METFIRTYSGSNYCNYSPHIRCINFSIQPFFQLRCILAAIEYHQPPFILCHIEVVHADNLMGGEEARSQDLADAQAALQAAGSR